MGLVKLYRVTGKEQYLSLAKFLLDARGPDPIPAGETVNPRGLDYNQAQLKVIDQTEPVGHAVRAMYMYAGMADVAALEDDAKIKAAGDKIWENLVHSKLYLTGGIGAAGGHEGFGDPYDLPNMSAYNETCASVGMDYWNERQFLLHGDAKYIDIMERTLYNGLISGVSLKGDTFFYPNPLESNGQHARQEWFGVACCPGNITRFMASVPGYIYAKREARGASADRCGLREPLCRRATPRSTWPGGKLKVVQATRYPWDGAVQLTLTPDKARAFTVNVRIPGWAREQPVPGDLYRFADAAAPKPTLKVNGAPVALTLADGYVAINRTWKAGDVIDLNLPMPVRRIAANDQVAADRDRVALQRGPIVYAAEWPDNPNGKVRNIVLPDGERHDRGVPRGPAERRDGGEGARRRARARRARRGAKDRAAVHGDPLRDVGEPRPRPDGGVAGADRHGGEADPLPHRRHHRHADQFAEHQEHQEHHRRRGSARVERLGVVLRLVAAQRLRAASAAGAGAPASSGGQGRPCAACSNGEWIEMAFAKAVHGFRDPDLLVRRHRPRRRASAEKLAAALQGWDRLETRRSGRRASAWRRTPTTRSGSGRSRPQRCARAGDAAQRLGRRAGVEGQVAPTSAPRGPGGSTRARRRRE